MNHFLQGVIAQNSDGRVEYLRAAEGGGFRHLWQMTDSPHEVANLFAAFIGSGTAAPTITGWSPWAVVAGPEAGSALTVGRNVDGGWAWTARLITPGRPRPVPSLAG
jgi:hypothetical protein